MAGQVEVVNPSPSGLQRRRVVRSAQEYAPGVQARVRHTPAAQVWLLVQRVLVYPRPSELHTRRVLASAQVAVPGVHTQPPQVPVVGEHEVPTPQARAAS